MVNDNLISKVEGKKKQKIWWYLSLLIFIGAGFLAKEVSQQNTIQQAVQLAKGEITLPYKVDSVTSLINIEEEANAIRYDYIVNSSGNWTSTQGQNLKNSAIQLSCNTPTIKAQIIDKGIGMEFLYTSANTSQSFLISITEKDC